MWSKGQTLMELTVVVAVTVVVISALTFATIASLRNSQFAKNQAQATKLAQEALEKVRSGRDRNLQINNLDPSVSDWNTIWGYQINGNCGDVTGVPPVYCYFNASASGALNHLTPSPSIPQAAEPIPPFKRAVILSDDSASYDKQKKVTVEVEWVDFSGKHQSKLTTILRKAISPPFVDSDRDGFGAGPFLSICPAGKTCVSNNQDCYDNNQNARPGQTGYFTTNRGDGSFDYDCNGLEEKSSSAAVTTLPPNGTIAKGGLDGPCLSLPPTGTMGYTNSVPDCGLNGNWAWCGHYSLSNCQGNTGVDPNYNPANPQPSSCSVVSGALGYKVLYSNYWGNSPRVVCH